MQLTVSEESYLAGLPLDRQLTGEKRRVFQMDALVRLALDQVKDDILRLTDGSNGRMPRRVLPILQAVQRPRAERWSLCPDCEGAGTIQVGMNSLACSRCSEAGYVVVL